MTMALLALAGASAASAAKFTAGGAGEAISETTTANHITSITESEIECENAEFTGLTTGTEAATLEVSPAYYECDAFGFESAVVVNTNTCDLVFSSSTSGSPGHADITLKGCQDKTAGIQRVVNLTPFAHCITDLPEQTISTAVRYENSGPGSISIDYTASEIMFDVTESAGLCPLTEGTHSGANGASYVGLSDFTTSNGIQYDS